MTVIGNPLIIGSSGGGGGGKNVQIYHGYGSVATTAYTSTGVSLTVAKSGTYKISWIGCRNSSSGTSGSRLYKNGVEQDSARTTFDDNNKLIQSVVLTGVSLAADDVITIYARARTTSYYMSVGNLVLEEQ